MCREQVVVEAEEKPKRYEVNDTKMARNDGEEGYQKEMEISLMKRQKKGRERETRTGEKEHRMTQEEEEKTYGRD